MHLLNNNMRRVILELCVLWAFVIIVLNAAAPAPHPWRRPRAGAGCRLRARSGSPPPARGVQSQPEPHAESRHTVSSQGSLPAAPGAAPDRRRRHRRAKYRGCRGGVSWARHGDRQPNDLLIGQLNIQSLKPKLADLRLDLSEVHQFDILALCESWLTPNVPNRLLQISGYKLCRVDRPAQSKLPHGYGGVALLVRDCYDMEKVSRPATMTTASSN